MTQESNTVMIIIIVRFSR